MSETPVLDATEQRVLGSLLEKQVTVPGSYPLSLNALRVACNQTSSRDPVTSLEDAELIATAKRLKERGLLRVVWAGQGSRTLKYHQLLDEALSLGPDERALVTVLLLRGAQTPGDLKTRTERLHAFADKDAALAALRRLAERPEPLTRELPLRPGQQDPRWVHLLGPIPDAAAAPAPAAAADREGVLANGKADRDARVRQAWDAAASDYADAYGDELTWKPFEVWLLERVATLAGSDPVLDLGCGPGHVTAFLADAGAGVRGIDLSPAMVARAASDYPDLEFEVGDAASLMRPRTGPGWGGVVAVQSLNHLAPSELGPTIAEMARVLRPDGWLLLAIKAGNEVQHLTELLGHRVDVDVVLHDPADVLAAVTAAGLTDVEWYLRNPGPRESGSGRLHVLARRP